MDRVAKISRRVAGYTNRMVSAPFALLGNLLVYVVIRALRLVATRCVNNGDYYNALKAYQAIKAVRPGDRFATFELLDLYSTLCRKDEAIRLLTSWLATTSDDFDAHACLAKLYIEKTEIAKAREHLDRASEMDLDSPIISLLTASLYRSNGMLDESTGLIESALEVQCDPDQVELIVNWGMLTLARNYIDQNRRADAVGVLEKAVRLSPDNPRLYYLLARSRYYSAPLYPHIKYMEQLISKGSLPASVKSMFHFALGAAYDSMDLVDAAFPHYRLGNELDGLRSNFQIAKMIQSVDRQIDIFNHDFFSAVRQSLAIDQADLGESLIFILGMPRSGTTLVEQILASHPSVHAGGERSDTSLLMEQTCAAANLPYPDSVRCLARDSLDQLAELYLTRTRHDKRQKERFVDKSIINWYLFGLLAVLFPRAKFIRSRRSALDTCLSCYTTHIPANQFSHDLRLIGEVYVQYERLMTHWQATRVGHILDLEYEQLVSTPSEQISRLLEYCGLPWDDACLQPQLTRRVVNTASANQVKMPINTQSVGRWKRYEKYIRPLIDVLGSCSPPLTEYAPDRV